MMQFGWFRFVFQFPTLSPSFPSVWGPSQARHLLLVSLFHSSSTTFLVLLQDLSICLPFRFLWSSLRGPLEQQDLYYSKFSPFFLIFTMSGLLVGIKWYVFISKSRRILCVSFSKSDSGWCIYHLVIRSNFNFLHNSQWIAFPTQSCLDLYSFCHSLIWLGSMAYRPSQVI